MRTIKAFKNHPTRVRHLVGGILLLVGGPGGIPGSSEQVETMIPLVLVALFAGPSVAGLLTTGLVSGRAGLRELLSRLLRWQVGARWYAAALLPAPLLVTTVLLALSLRSPEFIPGMGAAVWNIKARRRRSAENSTTWLKRVMPHNGCP